MALLIQHRRIYFPRRDIRTLRQIDVNKALIVTEIKIRLSPVIGDKYFAVLIRAHRSRINVDVGIKFLNCYLQSAILEQAAERCRSDALAER